MQISISVPATGFIALPLLIATVYMLAFLRIYHRARFSVADVLLIMLQVSNLILLLRCGAGYEMGFLPAIQNDDEMFIAQGIFILPGLMHFIFLFRKVRAYRRKPLLPQSIREAIDCLPEGICFAAPDGKPILTNRKMDELVFLLLNSTVTNALTAWEELRHVDSANGCTKVVIKSAGRGYRVEISDNGTVPVSNLTEGSGLSNLRMKLEQEGAALDVKCGNGVILIAELPTEEPGKSAREDKKE
jgi:hypothetical protein